MARNRKLQSVNTIIVGAGPVGILKAIQLKKHGIQAVVLEKLDTLGGLWKSFSHLGAKFENGLHFVHHPAKWNELLFSMDEEDAPLSEPCDSPLFYESRNWEVITSTATYPETVRPYLGTNLHLLKGTMADWLESLIKKHSLDIRFGESLINLSIGDNGIEKAESHQTDYIAERWIFTGAADHYESILPLKVLRTHSQSGHYLPAIGFQFIHKKPLNDAKSVYMFRQRMDHEERYFFGLFESNLDPTRAPRGMQTSTWMGFINQEEFEEPQATAKWKRVLRRALSQYWPQWDESIQWERFMAIPRAGGPIAKLKEKSERTSVWKNAWFLTHCASSEFHPFFWTTGQIVQSQSTQNRHDQITM